MKPLQGGNVERVMTQLRTPSVRNVILAIVFSLLAATTRAQNQTAVSTIVLPAVANIRGLNGVEWRTDVVIRNEHAVDLEIILTLATAPQEPFFMTALAAGQSMNLVDVVRQTFGLSEMISPLVIQTLGPRSPTVGVSIYAVGEGGLSNPEFVPVVYGRMPASLQSLDSLSVNEAYRTNIGIVNLSESPVEFSLSLQRVEGRSLAVRAMSLPPRSIIQAPIQAIFPVITEGDNFRVLIESSADSTYCYASVIDNVDHHAVFVRPLMVRAGPN